MKHRTEIYIPAPYEAGILLRRILKDYDARGIVKTANLRSLNYLARRLNVRALRAGAMPTDLHCPAELEAAE